MKRFVYKTDSRLLFFMALALSFEQGVPEGSKLHYEELARKAGHVVFDLSSPRYFLPVDSFKPIFSNFTEKVSSGELFLSGVVGEFVQNLCSHGHMSKETEALFSDYLDLKKLRAIMAKEQRNLEWFERNYRQFGPLKGGKINKAKA